MIITNHPRLTTLYCNNNTSLTTLTCYQNNLSFSNFFVNGNTALTKLSCYENPNLTGINGLEDSRAITYIDCEDCAITDLSALNSMNNIENIFARNNKLTTFTVVGKSNLTALRLSGNTLMTELKVYSNNLTSFYITNCTGLKTLWCWNNPNLTSISGLSDCTAIENFYCYDCSLATLEGVNNMDNLAYLGCYNNKLSSLVLEFKSRLQYVNCSGNTCRLSRVYPPARR